MMKFLRSVVVVAYLVALTKAQNSGEVNSPVNGPPNELTSYAVSSCGGANIISISNFEIRYLRSTHSVEFIMVATATQDGLSPTMDIDVTSYGSKLPTQTINLCDYASCPLSQNSTTIQGSQTLDQSYTNQIPDIFWTLPLDATVQLTFISTSDGTELSCISAKLFNGVSTHQAAIPWVTGFVTVGLIGAAGILGVAGGTANISAALGNSEVLTTPGSSPPGSPPPKSPLTSFYGEVAPTSDTTSLSLDAAILMGSAAVAGGTGTMLTAGNAGQTVGGPQTGMAPPTGHSSPPAGRMDPTAVFLHFQFVSSTGLLSVDYPSLYRAFTINFAWANLIIPLHAFRNAAAKMRRCNVSGSNSVIPPVGSGSGLGGIATYAAQQGIDAQDVFGVVYLVFLCACALLLVIYLVVAAVIQVAFLKSKDGARKDVWEARRDRWRHLFSNNGLRLVMAALGSLATFSFYQWTRRCTSGLTFFLSASALASVLLPLAMTSFFILYFARKSDGLQKLFTKGSIYERRWGSMYDTFKEHRLRFVFAQWIIVLMRSAITSFGQSYGFGQVIAMIALESIVCVGLFVYHPYYSPGYNRVNYLLQGTKLVSSALLLLFVDKLHINPIATTVAGFVLLVVNSIVALVLICLTILKLGWGRLWYRRRHAAFETQNVSDSLAIHDGGHTSTMARDSWKSASV